MKECTYRQTDMEAELWECSVCGAGWTYFEGGPKENDQHYCAKCGAHITRLEWPEWDEQLEDDYIKGEAYA